MLLKEGKKDYQALRRVHVPTGKWKAQVQTHGVSLTCGPGPGPRRRPPGSTWILALGTRHDDLKQTSKYIIAIMECMQMLPEQYPNHTTVLSDPKDTMGAGKTNKQHRNAATTPC